MCLKIVIEGIEDNENIIETPRQFNEHFGFLPDKNINYKIIDFDSCLCQCDIELTFRKKKISYKNFAGDYYVDFKFLKN